MAACEPDLAPTMRRALEDGRDAANEWIRESDSPTAPAAAAISLAYLDRLRLGLGSPFRLAEQALNDARLSEQNQRDVAWAILARTLERRAYQLSASALDGIARADQDSAQHAGSTHLALIDETIRQADDPRAGELAVRLAYTRAAANDDLSHVAPQLAARAAALIRDRELARDDVFELLYAAQDAGVDPLELIGAWRAQRRFAVEAPPLLALPSASERRALSLAEPLRIQLQSGVQTVVSPAPSETRVSSLLGPATTQRLLDLTQSASAPPQAPIAVAVGAARSDLLAATELDELTWATRERFVANAVSEESFVAEYALLHQRGGVSGAAARMTLSVAVAMRAYAQEPIWFPGFPAPTAEEVVTQHGLAEVRLAEGLPDSWGEYYLRVIDLALTDLRNVLPTLDLSGLRVVITHAGIREGTLALHEPRNRRLILPPESGAGTIAHEIAHDLDWQVALSRYGVRGDYASDGAARTRRDGLAVRFADLTNTSVSSTEREGANAHARRPTEVFARNVDWFVAVSLAAQARSNGYLTSIQDEVLTGYGSARPPDMTGSTGAALIDVLDEVAPLDPTTREAYLARYGRGRILTPYDHARRMLENPAGR